MPSGSRGLTFLVSFVVSAAASASDQLAIERAYWTADGFVRVDWSTPPELEVESFDVFVVEGTGDPFDAAPAEDGLDGGATAWESTERREVPLLDSLGIGLRVPGQWGRTSVLTPGYTYTVGLEMRYVDTATRKERSQFASVSIPPVRSVVRPAGKSYDPFAGHDLTDCNRDFVTREGGRYFFSHAGTRVEILGYRALPVGELFALADGRTLMLDATPSRPELFGNFPLAVATLLAVAVIVGAIVLAYHVWIAFLLFDLLDVSSEGRGQERKIIGRTLEKGITGCLAVYLFVSLVTLFHGARQLRYVNLEFTDEQLELMREVRSVLHRHRIHRWRQARDELLALLES